jgi:hypothetical protein
MAYGDFTLKKVKTDLGLQTIENLPLFYHINTLEIGDYLKKPYKEISL